MEVFDYYWKLLSFIYGYLFYVVYTAPFFLVVIIWGVWLYWRRALWIKNLKRVTLEVKIPKIIDKSPQAMEAILAWMYQTSQGTVMKEQWVQGRMRSWFSLEIVSFGGQIHFFINSEVKYLNALESQIYANYPEVEISAVDDYTRDMPFGAEGSDWQMFGMEYQLDIKKEDAYPIKTYVDYGLDRDIDESKKVDPMTPFLEGLGRIGPGEQFWFQIIIRASQKPWKKEGKALIEKLMKRDEKSDPNKPMSFGSLMLSPKEREVVEAIERSIDKYGFDTGIRVIYFAKQNCFDGKNISFMLSAMRHYGSEYLNTLGPYHVTSTDYWWQDYFGSPESLFWFRIKGDWLDWVKKVHFDAYRRRLFFHPPYTHRAFVMTTEEIATLFHFPGQVAKTPTLTRIESKRAEPPINLPI